MMAVALNGNSVSNSIDMLIYRSCSGQTMQDSPEQDTDLVGLARVGAVAPLDVGSDKVFLERRAPCSLLNFSPVSSGTPRRPPPQKEHNAPVTCREMLLRLGIGRGGFSRVLTYTA